MSARCRDIAPGAGRCPRLVRGSKNFYCDDHRRWTEIALAADLVAARARLACGHPYPLQIDRRGRVAWIELDIDTLRARVRDGETTTGTGSGAKPGDAVSEFIRLLDAFVLDDIGNLDLFEDFEESHRQRNRVRSELTTRGISSLNLEGGRDIPLRVHAQTRALQFRVEQVTGLGGGLRVHVWRDAPDMVCNWLQLDTWATTQSVRMSNIGSLRTSKVRAGDNEAVDPSTAVSVSPHFWPICSTDVVTLTVDTEVLPVKKTRVRSGKAPAAPRKEVVAMKIGTKRPKGKHDGDGGDINEHIHEGGEDTVHADSAASFASGATHDVPPPYYVTPDIPPPRGHADLKNPAIAALAYEFGDPAALAQSRGASRLADFMHRGDVGAIGQALSQFGLQ